MVAVTATKPAVTNMALAPRSRTLLAHLIVTGHALAVMGQEENGLNASHALAQVNSKGNAGLAKVQGTSRFQQNHAIHVKAVGFAMAKHALAVAAQASTNPQSMCRVENVAVQEALRLPAKNAGVVAILK